MPRCRRSPRPTRTRASFPAAWSACGCWSRNSASRFPLPASRLISAPASILFPVLIELLQRLARRLAFPLLVDQRATAFALIEILKLLLQLQESSKAIRSKPTLFNRQFHRASRLVVVPAIREVTTGGELQD